MIARLWQKIYRTVGGKYKKGVPGLSSGVWMIFNLYGRKNDKRKCLNFTKKCGFDFILPGKKCQVNYRPKNRMKDENFRVQGAK